MLRWSEDIHRIPLPLTLFAFVLIYAHVVSDHQRCCSQHRTFGFEECRRGSAISLSSHLCHSPARYVQPTSWRGGILPTNSYHRKSKWPWPWATGRWWRKLVRVKIGEGCGHVHMLSRLIAEFGLYTQKTLSTNQKIWDSFWFPLAPVSLRPQDMYQLQKD